MRMVRGNFDITDAPSGRRSMSDWWLVENGVAFDGLTMTWHDAGLTITAQDPTCNRLYIAFHAEAGEAVWGGGEQLSYLALNGRRFPMWTSEPGVGRDKSTTLTQQMDAAGMAGGDYWTTNYPQPTFLTSRWFAVHLDASCFSVLDFADPVAHRVEVWAHTARFEISTLR